MNNSIEYFYDNVVRWSFGFDNPNKAAVIFACLLPLLWILWNLAWDAQKPLWWRAFFALGAAGLIGADSLCLFKTYSRGGTVAAAAGVLYLLVRNGWNRRTAAWTPLCRSARVYGTALLIGWLLALFVGIGLGERSIEPITRSDASVSNRFTLWRGALEMAAENPSGFGTGKSGDAYMQWYQPIDATTVYRTMVNSYLTFLVEQGWLGSGLVFAAASLFWFWSQPARPGSPGVDVAAGLRAAILAFLVAGFFSTTMEEPRLWIIPSGCAVILAGWAFLTRVPLPRPQMIIAMAMPLLVLVFLYITGRIESRSDPLTRQFTSTLQGRTVSVLALNMPSTAANPKTWVAVPDTEVLGPCYGKLLRQLVLKSGIVLKLESPGQLHGPVDRLLLTGNAVKSAPCTSLVSTVLLSPAAIPSSSAQAWETSSPHLVLMVPSIDEDRRGRFWQQLPHDSHSPGVTVNTMNGIGLRVDWAWDDVIDVVKTL